MKKLVSCPNCEKNGRKEILGEIDNDNNFSIMRYSNQYTKIISDSFEVMCGVCGEVIFYRRKQ